MCRVISFMLAFLLIIGGCGVEAFAAAACTSDRPTHHVGWYTMANSSSSTPYGFSPVSFDTGHALSGVPTHSLKIGGKWTPAWCLTPPAGTVNGATYSCVDVYKRYGFDDQKKQTVLATLLYRAEQLGGITVDGDGNIPKCGGSTQTDHWLVVQLLIWSLTNNNIFFQGNGRIGITTEAKQDVNSAIATIKRTRANDANLLRGWVDSFYNQVDWMYRIPSFASYTSTHPLGKQVEGVPGSNGGTGTIILDKSCKVYDEKSGKMIYKKVIEDKNGVLNAFDFSGQFGTGYSGIQISQSGNKLTITYDGSTGCWKDESEDIKRKLPVSSNSVVFWGAVNNRDSQQYFGTHKSSTSELGCKVNLEIRDCGDDTPFDKSPRVSSPGTTTTTPPVVTETPNVETPPPAPPEVYIRKTSDDGNVSGIVFTITGNGETYHKKTDESGFLDVSDLPQYIEGTQQLIEYHVEEEIPVEYVHDRDNASKNFVLEPGKTQYLEFENKRKMWRLTFKKHDDTLATQAQGKGTLAGAVFAVYKDGQQIATYVTDENGVITTEYFPCGPGYTLVEIQAPPGYVGNSTVYAIGLMPGETLEQYNDCNRMEPLDGDDPEVIRKAYETKSLLEYKASLKGD